MIKHISQYIILGKNPGPVVLQHSTHNHCTTAPAHNEQNNQTKQTPVTFGPLAGQHVLPERRVGGELRPAWRHLETAGELARVEVAEDLEHDLGGQGVNGRRRSSVEPLADSRQAEQLLELDLVHLAVGSWVCV